MLRAIHIEISHTLDTSSFINALRRFIARRGAVIEIRSDNAKNKVPTAAISDFILRICSLENSFKKKRFRFLVLLIPYYFCIF